MADDSKQDLFPSALCQNPAPIDEKGQERLQKITDQTEEILKVFFQLVPSNYVSQIKGPFYTLQFQAAAEQIAKLQIAAQEVFADGIYDFTRSEFLFQILGTLVFPDATSDGYPTIPGDISYRTFLQRMVSLLLEGATKANVEAGLALLTTSDVETVEKSIVTRLLGDASGYGPDEQFSFEINVSRVASIISANQIATPGDEDVDGFDGDFGELQTVDLYGFPIEGPFVLQENVRLVMRALKPAHTIYEYRHLFRDAFGVLFSDEVTWRMDTYYYEEMRKYCLGCKAVVGSGETLTDRALFSDPDRDFGSITPGATLTLNSGPNAPRSFRVQEVLTFPVGDDVIARAYTTSPTGLTGTATIAEGLLEDVGQDFAAAVEGEKLTFTEGPNAGVYRLKTLAGNDGGPIGFAPGPGTRVILSPSLLRLDERMAEAAVGQDYMVVVDRLGVQVPQGVLGEDVSIFFVQ